MYSRAPKFIRKNKIPRPLLIFFPFFFYRKLSPSRSPVKTSLRSTFGDYVLLNRINKEGTASQQLTYKRIYFSCAQKRKNWNRTETEQWLRPQGFFFLPSLYRFFFFILRNPSHVRDTSPVSSLKQPRTTIPPQVLCFLLSKDFHPLAPAPQPPPDFYLFLLFLLRGKIPSAICWRRKTFAGQQYCSLFYCLPSALGGVTASSPLVSRWRLSVNARLIWDAKESAVEGGEMCGIEKVGVSLWGWFKDLLTVNEVTSPFLAKDFSFTHIFAWEAKKRVKLMRNRFMLEVFLAFVMFSVEITCSKRQRGIDNTDRQIVNSLHSDINIMVTSWKWS